MYDEEFQAKYRRIMRTPVFVDSPLAISATEVFKENAELFKDEVKEIMFKGGNPLDFPGLEFTRTAEESKALNENVKQSIIISASGMCDVGRIKHHLKHNLWDSKNTILFVGYQAPGTLGRSIVDGAQKVKIFGEEIAVNARIEYIEGYSGHADQEWLMNFVYSFINKPKQIFLVHGEEDSQEILKEKIEKELNIPVTIPSFGEIYELSNDNVKLMGQIEIPAKYRPFRLEVIERLDILKDEIKDMTKILKKQIKSDKTSDKTVFDLNERVKELEKKIVEILEQD